MNQRVKELIEFYNLKSHQEGGYFSENYRSNEFLKKEALPDRYNDKRCFGTSIYFLLFEKGFSAFHRLKSDEIWHFYEGSPLTIITIDKFGEKQILKLGNDIAKGQKYQQIVQCDLWFVAFPENEVSYSFVGCTVAPGFEYSDFELGKRDELISQFPQHKDLFDKYCVL